MSDPDQIERFVPYSHLLIGAVLHPGGRAPVLVTEEMVKQMRRGSVIVDVSVDQGGCVETIHPTTHDKPTYILHNPLRCEQHAGRGIAHQDTGFYQCHVEIYT